ncbi:hypothetical protein FRC07_013559 [Ceratobasidium sp. 392]|nr:hypothetical protein FRC07_013559 [Ceratobasidium sp. 392]
MSTYNPDVRHRVGGWLPSDDRVLREWLARLIERIDRENKPLEYAHPVIQEFQALIEGDLTIKNGFQMMFTQVPEKAPYLNDPTGQPQIRDYIHMLQAFDCIIQSAPEFINNDLVAFPINAILDWPMGTAAGLLLFRFVPVLNAQFKKMFDVWAQYLTSPASASVLTDAPNGWFGPAAQAWFGDFSKEFPYDPNAPGYGYGSWDAFFTRPFLPGVRPVISPDDDSVVNSACECAFYRMSTNVAMQSQIWLKGQPYSLSNMLNNDELTPQFDGGTVFQAFLSAKSYHRFASPVNGTVVKIVAIPGTYYAESPQEGFMNPAGPDPSAANLSQGYITSLAARTVIYIQADNPAIGLMAFVAVGMAEVSSVEVTVQVGQKIKKGDQTGMFHYGGSTHCLLFGKNVNITFTAACQEANAAIQLNSVIANVTPATAAAE